MCLIALPAHADEWFVDGSLGASRAPPAHLRYDDPVGSIFTVNRAEGTRIIPERTSGNPWSAAAAVSAAYLFDDRYFVRGTYRYFGVRSATADGLFFHSPFDVRQISQSLPQAIRASAHGVFLGVGIELALGTDWFVAPSLEVGAGVLRAAGTRDIGTIIEQPFPPRTRVNLAYGAGLIVGRRLGSNVAILLAANWNHLGRAETGLAPDIGGAPRFAPGVRPNASMTATFAVTSMMLGIRYGF